MSLVGLPDVAEATGDEIEVTLSWRLTGDGSLVGFVELLNVSTRTVRVTGKPRLTPIGEDGIELHAETVVTLEMRVPPYVDVDPGRAARANVGWAGWDGAPASGRVAVGWPGARVVVTADGPRQPTASEPTNLFSSWFVTTRDDHDEATRP